MSDVASRANVSVGWVSTYVNTPERVAPKRGERIQAAIDELGYVRNDAGRQLRRGTSSTVGFVAFDVADAFTYLVARGARRRAAEDGIRVVIADTDGSPDVERDYLQMFEEQRARGVLLSAINNDEYLEGASIRQPLVMIDHRNDSGTFDSVSVNNVLGGTLAARHLLEQGRRRIAFVGGPVSIQQIEDRLTGAQLAVAEVTGAELEIIPTAERDSAAGSAVAEQLLSRPASRRPDALFCVNDNVAIGVVSRLLGEPSISLPQDLAIIGYNDVSSESFPFYPLSSIRQPHEALGRTAVELLLAGNEPAAGEKHPQVIFDPELVVRASTSV